MRPGASKFAAFLAGNLDEERNPVTFVTNAKKLGDCNGLSGYEKWSDRTRVTRHAEKTRGRAVTVETEAEQQHRPAGHKVTGLLDVSDVASSPYANALAMAAAQCPTGMNEERWRQAIEDGRRFIMDWGADAERLGWLAEDLFGLHEKAPAYRYDEMGLIWLIDGGHVTQITAAEATIRHRSGAVLRFFRRQ